MKFARNFCVVKLGKKVIWKITTKVQKKFEKMVNQFNSKVYRIKRFKFSLINIFLIQR